LLATAPTEQILWSLTHQSHLSLSLYLSYSYILWSCFLFLHLSLSILYILSCIHSFHLIYSSFVFSSLFLFPLPFTHSFSFHRCYSILIIIIKLLKDQNKTEHIIINIMMDELPGAFGTSASLTLRLGQTVFSSASLCFICLDVGFYSYTSFSYASFLPPSLTHFYSIFLYICWLLLICYNCCYE
jgi:hypothetical protein